MIVLLVSFLLLIGAIATFFLPPEKRGLRIFASLLPIAALAILLSPIPLSKTFSIIWQPSQLFPEPPMFRADLTGVSFSLYLCCLLIGIEWTRPLRRSPGRTARIFIYILTVSGVIAFSASNALSVAIIWAWIDFLSFLAVLILNRSVEIDSSGITSSVYHSLSIFAINMLGNVLVLFPALQAPHNSLLDWAQVWQNTPTDLSVFLFLAGIILRLLVAPMQFTFSRSKSVSTGTEILLRILPVAAVLALLSRAWPPQLTLAPGNIFVPWACLFFALVILAAGLQWWIASSSFERRDIFFLLIPVFSLLTALLDPPVDRLFLASGGIYILGAGMVGLYPGFLPQRRWLSIFPILAVIIFSGIPFSPMSLWVAYVYPGLVSTPMLGIALPLLLGHIFLLSSILRLTFEPVEEFPPNEPLFLFLYSLGMSVCIIFIFYPGWNVRFSSGSIVFPVFLLAAAVGMFFLSRYIHRMNSPLSQFLEKTFRLQWLQNILISFFAQLASWISGLESFLSGEGVMLWSLGIALLIYLAFRGG
jgi:hypothetical protein